MEDLAALAGVSKITVSRALRDSPLVRESVRERIKELSAAHGYRLNAAARSLRTRRAHTITAAIEMDPTTERPLSEPIVLIVIGALLQAFATRGYRLVLTTRSEALSSNVLDTEGLILMGLGPNDEAIPQMQRFNLPLVVWGSSRPAFDNVVFLGSDNVGGGRLVGEHLLGLGRKRILFLGDTIHTEVAERLAGLTDGRRGPGRGDQTGSLRLQPRSGAGGGRGRAGQWDAVRRHRRLQRSDRARRDGRAPRGRPGCPRRCRGDRL